MKMSGEIGRKVYLEPGGSWKEGMTEIELAVFSKRRKEIRPQRTSQGQVLNYKLHLHVLSGRAGLSASQILPMGDWTSRPSVGKSQVREP